MSDEKIKVLKVTKCIEFYVETDNPEFGGDYRRSEFGSWEQRMGESWETLGDDTEIESAFKEYMLNN